jgi:predicted transcriptional regulator
MSKQDTPTTLRLPVRLKRRIAVVAKDEGRTAHAFMLEVLEEGTALAEKRRSFQRDADLADAETEASNLVYPAEAVFEYIEKLARGQKVQRPKPVAWRK